MDSTNNKVQLVVTKDNEPILDKVALMVGKVPYYDYIHSLLQYNYEARDNLRSEQTKQLKRLFELDMPDSVRVQCNNILTAVIAVEREMNTKRRITISKVISDMGANERREVQLYMSLVDLKCTFEPYTGTCDLCNKPIENVCMIYNGAKIHIKTCV